MVKKLISKAELSRRAGVTAAAVTKAIRNGLNAAMDGKRIDANHPLVVKYITDRAPTQTGEPPATGIDPLYEDAVNHCRESGRYTASSIQRALKIGYNRACKILAMMKAAGTDKPGTKSASPPPPDTKGIATKSTTKKAAALAKLNDVDTGTIIHEIPEDISAFIDMTLREILQRHGTDTAFLDWLKATKSIEDINEKRLKNAVTRGELVSRELMKTGVIEPINAAHLKLLTDGAKTIALRVTVMHGAGRPLEDCEKFVADQIGSFIKPMKSKITRSLKNA